MFLAGGLYWQQVKSTYSKVFLLGTISCGVSYFVVSDLFFILKVHLFYCKVMQLDIE
jgi:hypothetical protein